VNQRRGLWHSAGRRAAGGGLQAAGYSLRHTPSGPSCRQGSLADGDGDDDGEGEGEGEGGGAGVGCDETGAREPGGCDGQRLRVVGGTA
jgi:hypothetical protein